MIGFFLVQDAVGRYGTLIDAGTFAPPCPKPTVVEITLDGDLDPATAEAQVREMCEKLLANTVIENYRIERDTA